MVNKEPFPWIFPPHVTSPTTVAFDVNRFEVLVRPDTVNPANAPVPPVTPPATSAFPDNVSDVADKLLKLPTCAPLSVGAFELKNIVT